MDNHDNQDLIDMLQDRARQLQMKNELIELQNRQLKEKDKQISVLQQNYLKLLALARGAPPVAPGTNRVISGGSLLSPQHSGAVSLTPQPQQQQSGSSSSSSSSTVRIESCAAIDGMQHSQSVSLANLIPPESPSPPNVPPCSSVQAGGNAVMLMSPSTRAEPNREN